MGVFQIRNTVNGKILIESSPNLDKIWNRHQAQLNFGSHQVADLQKDWQTLGAESFVFEILSEIEPEEDSRKNTKALKTLEQMFIEEFQPFGEKGYH